MNQKRQLAAILFADIVGYTALMQTNEQQALSALQKFKTELEAQIPNQKGEIIQFYGDGCLVVFNSSVDAVSCAKQLQEAFQNAPKVPVRIGLHLGDVVFKEDNVFGDAVNIASRVESMGISGAVLLSSSIRNQIKNKPEFDLANLGKFEFKNVEQPMTVYALANEGFPVPKRKEIKGKLKPPALKRNWLVPSLLGLLIILVAGFWYAQHKDEMKLGAEDDTFKTPLSKEIRDKRVAVMIFENKTGSENLEDFGMMISDWVTKGLMETGEAKVYSVANIQQQQRRQDRIANLASIDLINKVGVGVVLQGRYYLQENQLIIHSNIVDAEKGEVIHALNPIHGSQAQILDLLNQLTQEVLSYWAIRKNPRFLFNPPKYEAFQLYLEGEKYYWSDFQKAKSLFSKSYELDNSFYSPLFSSYGLHHFHGQRASADSIVSFIQQLNPIFTQSEKLNFEGIIAFQNRQVLKTAQLAEKRYNLDPSDEDSNWSAGLLYLYANYPKKAIELLNGWEQRYFNGENRENLEVSTWEGLIAGAYIRTGAYHKALEVVESYFAPKVHIWIPSTHLTALIRLDSLESFAQQFKRYQELDIYGNGGKKISISQLYIGVCQELYMTNNKRLLKKYIQEYEDWIKERKDVENFKLHRAWLAFLLEEYNQAISFLEKGLIVEMSPITLLQSHALLGVCYAHQNAYKKVQIQIDEVFNIPNPYTNSRLYAFISKHYFKARIEAATGEKDLAVQSLKEAIEAGTTFATGRYKNDPFLKPLFGYPPFEELVKPKG